VSKLKPIKTNRVKKRKGKKVSAKEKKREALVVHDFPKEANKHSCLLSSITKPREPASKSSRLSVWIKCLRFKARSAT